MRCIKIIICSIVLFCGISLFGTDASAAMKTVNGTPVQLRGKYWRTKIRYYKGFPNFIYYHVTKNAFYYTISQSDDYGVYDSVINIPMSAHHWFIGGRDSYSPYGTIIYEVKTNKNDSVLSVKGPWSNSSEYAKEHWKKYYRFHHFPRYHGMVIR